MAKIKNRTTNTGVLIKTPEEGGGSDHLTPLFCLSLIARDFCVLDCETNEQAAFACKLRKISQMTWRELKNAPREGLGFESIYNIDKDKIPAVAQGKRILAFRISEIHRLIGYRDNRVFHIIWNDPRGRVYPH